MNWLALAAIAWGVLAPLATWGLTEGKYRLIEIPNARAAAAREATAAEHERATKACNDRVEGIRQQIAAASEEARKLAEEAASAIGATPAEKSALQSVCNASSSCRDRQQGVKP